MFEVLKGLLILSIALPFIYMTYDVFKDLSQRTFKFAGKQLKPILVSVISNLR